MTCVHLNYRDEPIRLKEIQSIKNKLDTIIPVNEGIEPLHIWTGDFNALTKEDYTSDEWQTITTIRKQNNWESPQVDVIKKVMNSLKSFIFKVIKWMLLIMNVI